MFKHFDWRIALAGTVAGWLAGLIAGCLLGVPAGFLIWMLVASPIGAIITAAWPPRKKDRS